MNSKGITLPARGENTLSVRFKDAAGNVSAPVNSSITYLSGQIIAGDCDHDGTVTIAETQSAINMYLGLKAAAGCVDLDNSGNVSIAQVQKVINNFLGL